MKSAVPARWFSKQVLNWFDKYGRHDLPWKKPICPYRIWVSEIMLQQTQVATVIDYFERFMHRFPTIQTLATAQQDDVLALWAGLGYYARARNLYKTANIIVNDYQGIFPNCIDTLQSLPGIGASTAGAIVAQAFDHPAVILDGNVKRILSRLFCVPGAINDKQTLAQLWQYAEALTPNKRVADYTQAIMDIGATVCTKSKPNCSICPLSKKCQAFLTQQQSQFPIPKAQKLRPLKKAVFLGLWYKNRLLLEKRPNTGIWGGLYSLLEFSTLDDMRAWCQSHHIKLPIQPKLIGPLLHTFTHYQLEYHTYFHTTMKHPSFKNAIDLHWILESDLSEIGIPAPIRKVLNQHLKVAS